MQEFRLGRPPQDGTQLPPQVPGVVHGHVHALTGLGAVRVAGIAGDEHPRQAGGHLRRRHVVELVAQPLADLVHRPPPDVFHLNAVRVQDPVRDRGQLLRGDTPVLEHLLVADVVQLDVEPDQVSALARNDKDVALVRGVDRAFEPDVREVGDRQGVQDAPGLVHRVADQFAADRGPGAAARAVAADDILGPDRRGFAGLLEVLQVLQGDRHRVLRRAAGVDLDVAGVEAVERLQLAGRPLHVIQKVGEHARLVDDHVRHLRQALFDVLDTPGTRDLGPVLRVRPPEGDLVDPVALVDQTISQTERLEHLDGAAGNTVGLADLERTVLAVDDDRPDVGEVGHLRSQHETGRTAADDQDVGVLREASRPLRDGRMRVLDERVAGLIAVQIELHRSLPSGRLWWPYDHDGIRRVLANDVLDDHGAAMVLIAQHHDVRHSNGRLDVSVRAGLDLTARLVDAGVLREMGRATWRALAVL